MENRGNTFNSIDFVVTTDGKLILGKKHHFLGKATDVEAAGTLKLSNGRITRISNDSGHYEPSVLETEKYPTIFKQLGLDLDRTSLEILYIDEAGFLRTKTIQNIK